MLAIRGVKGAMQEKPQIEKTLENSKTESLTPMTPK